MKPAEPFTTAAALFEELDTDARDGFTLIDGEVYMTDDLYECFDCKVKLTGWDDLYIDIDGPDQEHRCEECDKEARVALADSWTYRP